MRILRVDLTSKGKRGRIYGTTRDDATPDVVVFDIEADPDREDREDWNASLEIEVPGWGPFKVIQERIGRYTIMIVLHRFPSPEEPTALYQRELSGAPLPN